MHIRSAEDNEVFRPFIARWISQDSQITSFSDDSSMDVAFVSVHVRDRDEGSESNVLTTYSGLHQRVQLIVSPEGQPARSRLNASLKRIVTVERHPLLDVERSTQN